jgi:hypothetical protein
MLVVLMRGTYEVRHRDGRRWRDIHTKFYNDRFRRSDIVGLGGGGGAHIDTETHTAR